MAKYVMAMDQGTTSSRSIIFDKNGTPIESMNKEFEQIYPKPGWVEHRPLDIWNTQMETAKTILRRANVDPSDIAAIGVTNQRETTTIWDKNTGEPIMNSIVWQCRRTANICDDLKARGWGEKIRKKTGVVCDAYFSGTKIKWMLDNVPGGAKRPKRRSAFRHHRHVADLEAVRREAARHGLFQRLQDDDLQYPHPGLGRRAA